MKTTTNKVCRSCAKKLPLDEFYNQKGSKDGKRPSCKICWKLGKPAIKKTDKVEVVPEDVLPNIAGTPKDGGELVGFDTISEASKTLGIDSGSISRCVNGKAKSAGGYIWVKSN